MEQLFEKIGLIASIILPFFNIPLIARIIQRKSSADVSLTWTIGVWVCFLFMLPAGLSTDDIVFKTFSIMNIVFFTVVAIAVLKYHKGIPHEQ